MASRKYDFVGVFGDEPLEAIRARLADHASYNSFKAHIPLHRWNEPFATELGLSCSATIVIENAPAYAGHGAYWNVQVGESLVFLEPLFAATGLRKKLRGKRGHLHLVINND